MPNYKIQMEGISKIFNIRTGPFTDVQNLTFGVEEKDLITLVGPSGCGKSTVIRMLNGIIVPTSGRITISGVDYDNGISGEILRKLGFVFQSHNLLPWLTVRRNLEIPLKIFKLKGEKWQNNIDALLEIVGLSDYAEAYPSELSGGMQQRIGVIRAMVYEPEILFMDEPFGALDETTREQLDLETLAIWEKTGKTIIFITHNVEEAVLMSSRVIVMGTDPGRIIEEVAIDLPRPRTLEMITSDQFTDYTEYVTGLIGEIDLNKIK